MKISCPSATFFLMVEFMIEDRAQYWRSRSNVANYHKSVAQAAC